MLTNRRSDDWRFFIAINVGDILLLGIYANRKFYWFIYEYVDHHFGRQGSLKIHENNLQLK